MFTVTLEGTMIRKVADILEKASQSGLKPHVTVVGADNYSVVETMCEARKRDLATGVLVGSKSDIEAMAEKHSLDISGLDIVDQPSHAASIEYCINMAREGQADILMKGQVQTSDLMRAVLASKGSLRTQRTLSYVAVLDAPKLDRVIMMSDPGINIAPNLERKIDIVRNAVDVGHVLGIKTPRVAMLSFSEKISDSDIPEMQHARELVRMNREGDIDGCIIEGPMGLDMAVSPEAARIKGVSNNVVGQADALITPDINMGQAIYKTLQMWQGTPIAGVVMGGRIPILLASRSDGAATKLSCLALAILLTERQSEA